MNKIEELKLYEDKISKILEFLLEENKNIEKDFDVSNEDLSKMKASIIGMGPKNIGGFLEKILLRFYNIDEFGNTNSENDGIHQTEKIEIKSSRALHQEKTKMKTGFDFLKNYNRRLLSINELTNLSFDCNMQQVKPEYFDKIYYGILTENGFLVFKMNKMVLLSDKNISYSDKQHRGNFGEGQFHVKKSNIKYHMLHYYEGCISWYNIIKILKDLKI